MLGDVHPNLIRKCLGSRTTGLGLISKAHRFIVRLLISRVVCHKRGLGQHVLGRKGVGPLLDVGNLLVGEYVMDIGGVWVQLLETEKVPLNAIAEVNRVS